MTERHGFRKIVRISFLFVCMHAANAAYSLETAFFDSMSLNNDRKEGQSLANSAMEKGDATWFVDASVIFRADGTATSAMASGGTAYHALPFAADIYRISAEINASSTSCTAIAFSNKIPLKNFFLATALSLIFTANGDYEIMGRGIGRIKSGSKADYPSFNVDGFTKIELEYNSIRNTLTAKINGVKVLDEMELALKKIGPFFTHASFRFNGPLTPSMPMLKNYSVVLVHESAPTK